MIQRCLGERDILVDSSPRQWFKESVCRSSQKHTHFGELLLGLDTEGVKEHAGERLRTPSGERDIADPASTVVRPPYHLLAQVEHGPHWR